MITIELSQRLTMDQIKSWEALGYGMMLTFGMNTFLKEEHGSGKDPAALYSPSSLDVGQWVSVARDSGMRYGVLVAKHTSGFCLWPSKQTSYHIGNSGNKTDVVEAYVNACRQKGVKPGLYYCLWDNHNRFGSFTPTDSFNVPEDCQKSGEGKYWWLGSYTTPAYWDFVFKQLEELLTQYGEIFEIWIDIPGMFPRVKRNELYQQLAQWQPNAVIVLNNGIGDGSAIRVEYAWPTDVTPIERFLPNSTTGYEPIKKIEGKSYYLPGEVCEPIGKCWQYEDHDQPRSVAELMGMYLVARSRGTNLLLNVPPDRRGLIADRYIDNLKKFSLRKPELELILKER